MYVNVHVKLFGVFRSAAKTSELDLQVQEEDATVKSIISQLLSQESYASLRQLLLDSETADPRPNALIMVSGREINTLNGLETKLTEKDELSLLPVAHGG
jgi:molybdopterin converting factor small subunit